MDEAQVLIEPQGPRTSDRKMFGRALARCLSVSVRDGQGRILAAESIVQLSSLESCCRKDIARRKLLAMYGKLLVISHKDGSRVSLAAQYVDCAHSALAGREFFEMFKTLERQRLGLKDRS